jgi:hypothetical protein
MKIPATKPQWANGKYLIWENGAPAGYFRQHKSAWRWIVYMRAVRPGSNFAISLGGTMLNSFKSQ